MSIKTDLKAIHKVSIKDIKRNYILISTILFSLIICLFLFFLSENITEKRRWIVYAIFLFISNLFIPLAYSVRYSDKNKQIISTIIYTKTHHILLYEYFIGLYYIVTFSITYGIVLLFLFLWKTASILDVYLFFSSICVWCITNGICILCFHIFHKYYIGLIIYVLLCIFFLSLNNIMIGFLFPFQYENNSILYFIGKLIEFLIVVVGNFILMKKKLSYK